MNCSHTCGKLPAYGMATDKLAHHTITQQTRGEPAA